MNATLEKIRSLQNALSAESREGGEHYSLGQLLRFLEPLELALAGLFFSVPFLQPIPLPGLSTPFGGVLAVMGGLQVFGLGHAALPRSLRDRQIETATIQKVLLYCEKLLCSLNWIPFWSLPKFLSVLARPRVLCWHIIFMSVMLALPLPIPLSNSIPAWGIVFTCLAMLESNALFVIISYALLVANGVFFTALFYLAAKLMLSEGARHVFSLQGIEHLKELLQNLFF